MVDIGVAGLWNQRVGVMCRQLNDELSSLPGVAGCEDAALMASDDCMADAQAQAGAFVDRFGGEERVEYLVLNILWNARSVVPHRDFVTSLMGPHANAHFPGSAPGTVGEGGVDGVLQEVDDQLYQLVFVPVWPGARLDGLLQAQIGVEILGQEAF